MSLSRPACIAGVCAALLISCSFTPAYHQHGTEAGPTASIGTIRNTTIVAVEGEREAFILEHLLRQRLGAVNADPRYELAIDLKVSTREGPLIGRETHRYVRVGTANLLLREAGPGRVLVEGNITATASWDATRWSVVNQAAFDDANERVLSILADRIHSMLLARTAPGRA